MKTETAVYCTVCDHQCAGALEEEHGLCLDHLQQMIYRFEQQGTLLNHIRNRVQEIQWQAESADPRCYAQALGRCHGIATNILRFIKEQPC